MESTKNYYNYNKNQKPNNYKDNRNERPKGHFQLPPASALAEYEDLSEGAADKIIEMLEAEQIQRHEIENYKVRTDNSYRYISLLTELVIVFSVILSAMYFHHANASVAIIMWGFSLIIVGKIIAALKSHSRRKKFHHQRHNKPNYNKPNQNKDK